MRQGELTGKVQTVLGTIDADSLGVTLPHEHLLLDGPRFFVEPTEANEKRLAHQPITLENLYWVKLHAFNHADNLKLTDEQLAIKEALLYKWAGGDTIVELTPIGLCRDPLGLARIARATGLNVVMGSGYYIGLSHPPELATKTEEEITEEIVRDIMVGVGDTGVHAGIIGEIGCSTPLEDSERKVLRASATAQRRTGAALNIHPTMSEYGVLEIIKILGDAGADLSRTVISHQENLGINTRTTIYRKLVDAGCYIEFDTLGFAVVPLLTAWTAGRLVGKRSEVDRINEIKRLIDEGYLNHILISQDVGMKICYVTYGGAGYAHILRDIVPWMRLAGISDEQIHTMMVENPKRVLPLAPVKE